MTVKFRLEKCENLLMWLILVVSLSLSSVSAENCTFPRAYPEGTLKSRFGKPVEIFCTSDHSADDLQFRKSGVVMPSEKINDTTIRLYKLMDKGVYTLYCSKTCDNITTKMCTTRVLVDEPPLDVTDFKCKSNNLDQLSCAWRAPFSYSVTIRTLYFIIHGRRLKLCEARTSELQNCVLSTSSNPRYRQLERQYFTLRSTNIFGSTEQNFTIVLYSIVQPARIEGLKILDVGVCSARLQWRVPFNMAILMPNGVTHKIEYQIAKLDNTSYFRSVDTSSLPRKNESQEFVILLPYTGMTYEVRVSIRPVEATGEEYWSEFSYIKFQTAGESVEEMGKNWKKNVKLVYPNFNGKLRRMEAQKHLINVWRNDSGGTVALLPLLFSGSNGINEA